MSEGSVALLATSALLVLALCAWLVATELRLRRRRDRWRPRPPPRPPLGARPSRVLLLAAEGSDTEEGYIQPRSFPPATLPATLPARAPAPVGSRAHSYLLVLGGDPAGATTPAYEEVVLRPKGPASEEGYVPMQRRRVPTVLRVLRGKAQAGELALELRAVGVACDEYLFMQPQTPHASHADEDLPHAEEVAPAARPLPPLPAHGAEYSTCGPPP